MPVLFMVAASCRPYRAGVELHGLARPKALRDSGVRGECRPTPCGGLAARWSAMVSRWTGDYPLG